MVLYILDDRSIARDRVHTVCDKVGKGGTERREIDDGEISTSERMVGSAVFRDANVGRYLQKDHSKATIARE